MKLKKWIAAVLLSAVTATALSGCGQTETKKETSAEKLPAESVKETEAVVASKKENTEALAEVGKGGEVLLPNTCPIFGPDGSLIDVYRKKAPYYPVEGSTPSTSPDYCTFYIPGKNVTVGVQICYDQFFPEIARTLALEGAELILTPSYEPAEYEFIPDVLPRARALENECYYIWSNGVGGPCGNSTIIDPEGMIIYKFDSTEMTYTASLDFAKVTQKRLFGQDLRVYA